MLGQLQPAGSHLQSSPLQPWHMQEQHSLPSHPVHLQSGPQEQSAGEGRQQGYSILRLIYSLTQRFCLLHLVHLQHVDFWGHLHFSGWQLHLLPSQSLQTHGQQQSPLQLAPHLQSAQHLQPALQRERTQSHELARLDSGLPVQTRDILTHSTTSNDFRHFSSTSESSISLLLAHRKFNTSRCLGSRKPSAFIHLRPSKYTWAALCTRAVFKFYSKLWKLHTSVCVRRRHLHCTRPPPCTRETSPLAAMWSFQSRVRMARRL